ncbi:4Fe-4S binding protein [Streptosporangium sp. CA-135522]|uniref:NuoI/complex I 23 kDa subunit family protein n=1 Tax=Streptosporangium sp. CA-135522 TaxID=3240072 RepID=UPI003D93B922
MGLAKGLSVTLRHMLSRSVTRQYPEVRPDLPPRSRGVIALVEENCTVCMLCARECPDWCIYIDSHKETLPAPEGGRPRARNVLDRFAIDFSLCMYCGICIEVCPFDALFWSPEFEYAEGDIRNLVHEKDKLAAWVQTVPPPPAHEPNADPPKELAAASRPTRPGPAGPGVPRAAASVPRSSDTGAPGVGSSGTDTPGPTGPADMAGSSGTASMASTIGTADTTGTADTAGTAGTTGTAGSSATAAGAPEPAGPIPGSPGADRGSSLRPGDTAPDGTVGRSAAGGETGTAGNPDMVDGPGATRAPETMSGPEATRTSGTASKPDVTGRPGAAGESGVAGGPDAAGAPSGRRPPRPARTASAGHANVRAIRPPGALPKKDDSSTGKPAAEKLSTGEGGVPPAVGKPEQDSSTDPTGEPEEEM